MGFACEYIYGGEGGPSLGIHASPLIFVNMRNFCQTDFPPVPPLCLNVVNPQRSFQPVEFSGFSTPEICLALLLSAKVPDGQRLFSEIRIRPLIHRPSWRPHAPSMHFLPTNILPASDDRRSTQIAHCEDASFFFVTGISKLVIVEFFFGLGSSS